MKRCFAFVPVVIVFLGLQMINRAAERPPVIGRNAGISAGHPLATAAGLEILMRGGNAFDAGVATLLVAGVVEQDFFSLGGEALVLVYPRGERKVTSIVGQGWAPKAATIRSYTTRGRKLDGAGLDAAVAPGAVHAAAERVAHRARAVGNDDFRTGFGAGDRIWR